MAAYTSSEEFDLERRVWLTNEVVPYDIYKALNSSVRTEFWKWLLGTVKVEYNLPYRVYSDVSKAYVHDTNLDEVYLKMTNGQVSENYGPTTSENQTAANYNPTYTRMEIDGVIMPEYDLMLHEVYRYLETLYPDHPDERKLLTANEFNDTILAAGDMINYLPDVGFFDKVASTLAVGLSNDDIDSEAAKIKIRNLLNNSFRRKLYGSKAGYRMFANDIFQLCTIFPVATYLPVQPVDPSIISKESATINNQAVLDALNMSKQEYKEYTRKHNRVIDTYSELYYRKFRLVDWDGKDSSYLQKSDANTYVYGYSIPCNENRIYEYPNADDSSAQLDNIIVGSTIEIDNDKKGITYITDISDDVFTKEISKNVISNKLYGRAVESTTKEIHYVNTSHNNLIPYYSAFVYKDVPDLLDIIKAKDEKSSDVFNTIEITFESHFGGGDNSININYLEAIYLSERNKGDKATVNEILDDMKPSILKVVPNPYIENTLLLEPSKSISYYPAGVPTFDAALDSGGNATGNIDVHEDTLVDNLHIFGKLLGDHDLTKSADTDLNNLYYISSFNKGSIQGTFNEKSAELLKELPTVFQDDRYGIVINTVDNNKVVLFGNLTVTYNSEGKLFRASKFNFNITCIPETKPDALLKNIYPDYDDIIKAKELVTSQFAPFEYVGMTAEGCEDLITLLNADRINVVAVNDIEAIEPTNFGKFNGTIYYKTYNNKLLTLDGYANLTDTDILSIYDHATGLDYSEYLELYLENKTYDEVLDSYRQNRSYMYTTGSATSDLSIDEEDWPTFEKATIRAECSFDKIISIGGYPSDVIFYNTKFFAGVINEISLGNLNILPLIENHKEYVHHYKTTTSATVDNLIEGKYKIYDVDGTLKLYWPIDELYENSTYNEKRVDLTSTVDTRVDYNSQAYSYVPKDEYSSNTKSILDIFLNYKNDNGTINKNITVVPISHTTVTIESVVDLSNENSSNKIFFNSDVAKTSYKTLSVGDRVYGPSIDSNNNDVYITSIGYNYVTVNYDFAVSGRFLFTYECKLNITIDETEKVDRYKDNLDTYGLYSLINPFEHGLWGSSKFPYASNAILESLPDISFFKPYNYITKNSITSISSFNEVMNKIHPKRFLNDKAIRIPSTIKFMNDLFVELNLTKVISTTTRSGKKNALISVDWLDYISNSLKDISRATDRANVGTNLMMETDSSGYYTMSDRYTYTDPNVQLKFITMNFEGVKPMWNNNLIDSLEEWTVPAYAQIGTGGNGRYTWFTSPADIVYPNIWGNNIYDGPNISDKEIELLHENNGQLRKRSTWGKNENTRETIMGSSMFRTTEKPLFEIPLGEYDIQTRYLPSNNTDVNRACTTIQSSFYAQTFNKLTKYMSADTSSKTGDVLSTPIRLNNKNFLTTAPISIIEGMTPTYLGTWEPESSEIENSIYTINTSNIGFTQVPGEYVYIPEDKVLEKIKTGTGSEAKVETKTFKHHTLVVNFGNNNFRYLTPEFMGTLTDNNASTLSADSDANIKPTKLELAYHIILGLNIKLDSTKPIGEYIPQITAGNKNVNKVFWFINDMQQKTFDTGDINNGDIVGLITPDHASEDINDFKYVVFNRCYYTSTLPILRPLYITDDDYNLAIGNKYSTIEELNLNSFYNLDVGKIYTNASKDDLCLISTNDLIKKVDGKFVEGSASDTITDNVNYISKAILSRLVEGSTYKYTGPTITVKPNYNIYIADEESSPTIAHDVSPVFDISNNVTEIKLPRKCVAEGSYNFDYIIDAGLTCTGYLYSTSHSNEVSYSEDTNHTEFDYIENDNFDIIDKSSEVSFNITRGAIYKDEDNSAFYTYTDMYTDDNGEQHTCFDKLKKVAIKFEEQKYFKNTINISGIYKNNFSQASGSSDITETAVLQEVADLGEFNTNLISSNDRILRITPIDLRSVYTEYLEPVFYSKYYKVDAVVRGIDKENNLILSYDDTTGNTIEKLSFNAKLATYKPVNKVFNEETQSYDIEKRDEIFLDFNKNTEFMAPTIYKDSVEYTKSIISDNRVENPDDYEFKYYKNLLLLKASVNPNTPDRLVKADTDNGQFQEASLLLQPGDTVKACIKLTSGEDVETYVDITLLKNGNNVANDSSLKPVSNAFYDKDSSTFVCLFGADKVGFAQNVKLPEETVVNLNYVSKLVALKGTEAVPFDENAKITEVSCDDGHWYFTVCSNDIYGVYTISVDYEAPSGFDASIIYVTTAFGEQCTYTNEDIDSIKCDTEAIAVTNNGAITYSDAYLGTSDLCIKSKDSNGQYNIEPYMSNVPNARSAFIKDTKTPWAVYICGRDVFVKSPVYLKDAKGNYTSQLSNQYFWKKTHIPITYDRTSIVLKKTIDGEGPSAAWTETNNIREDLMSGFDALERIDPYIVTNKGKYQFKYRSVTTGTDVYLDYMPTVNNINGTYPQDLITLIYDVKEQLGYLQVNDITLAELKEKYCPYYIIVKNLKAMPWSAVEGQAFGTTISDFIGQVGPNQTLYYYYNSSTNTFTASGQAPSVSISNVSSLKEYLKCKYNSTTKQYEITYYGVGPYKGAKKGGEVLTDIYGADLTFSTVKTYYSTSKNDYSWYAEYLSNLSVYGYLTDDHTAYSDNTVSNVLFTNNNLVFITKDGFIVTIPKNKTYKTEDIHALKNWNVSTIPQGYSYTYINETTDNQIIKTVKYGVANGVDKTFEIATNYASKLKTNYRITSVYSRNNEIVLGGYVLSRKDIEAEWANSFDADDRAVPSNQERVNTAYTALSNCATKSAFYFKETPLVLYSSNGGDSFIEATWPELLPNNERRTGTPSELTGSTGSNGTILTRTGVKVGNETMKTAIYKSIAENKADIIVYDNIVKSGNNYTLQNNKGIKVTGISYKSDEYIFALREVSSNKDYNWVVSTTRDEHNELSFKKLVFEEISSSTSGSGSGSGTGDGSNFGPDSLNEINAVKTNYDSFSLVVSPEANRVQISSNKTIDISGGIKSASYSEIIFYNDVIDNSLIKNSFDVLIAVDTQRIITLADQIKCINYEFLNDYFDSNNECLLNTIKEVSSRAEANLMYNYREAINESDLATDNFGYKSVKEDTDHVFYEYNQSLTGDTSIYTPVVFRNAYETPIYLCNKEGKWISKTTTGIVNTLSLYDCIYLEKSGSVANVDTTVLTTAAKPVYSSVRDAKNDSALRSEDKDFKQYFDVDKISAINTNYQLEPYSSIFTCDGDFDRVSSGDYIFKSNDELHLTKTNPSDIYVGSDISKFSLDDICNVGPAYIQYNPDTVETVNNNAYIYKNAKGNVSIEKVVAQDITVSYRTNFNFVDIINMPNNSAIMYIGGQKPIIAKGTYIINDNGKYTISATKPESGVDLGTCGVLNDIVDSLENSIKSYQRRYTGDNYKIITGSYIMKLNDRYTILRNFQYPSVDAHTFEEAINISDKHYSTYLGDTYVISQNTYIANEKGIIKHLTTKPLTQVSSITDLTLENIKKVPKNSFALYSGNVKTIVSGQFIVNINGVYYLTNVNPNTYVEKTPGIDINANFQNIITALNGLSDKNAIYCTGKGSRELIGKNDYIFYANNVLSVVKNPIEGLTTTVDKQNNVSIPTITSLTNNKYIEYALPTDIQINNGDIVYNNNNFVAVIKKADAKLDTNAANGSIVYLSQTSDKSGYKNITGKDQTILAKNSIIYSEFGVLKVYPYTFDSEIGSIDINKIVSLAKNNFMKTTKDLTIKSNTFVYKQNNALKTATSLPANIGGTNTSVEKFDLTATLNRVATLGMTKKANDVDTLKRAKYIQPNATANVVIKKNAIIHLIGNADGSTSVAIVNNGTTSANYANLVDIITGTYNFASSNKDHCDTLNARIAAIKAANAALEKEASSNNDGETTPKATPAEVPTIEPIDAYYKFTGNDITLNIGDRLDIATSTVTSYATNFTLDRVVALSDNSYFVVRDDYKFTKGCCIVNNNGTIQIDTSSPIASYTKRGTFDISDFNSIFSLESNVYARYTGSDVVLKDKESIIKINNQFSIVTCRNDFITTLTGITSLNKCIEYTGTNVVFNKNSFLVKKQDKYELSKDPTIGYTKFSDITSFNLESINNIKSYRTSSSGAYCVYTDNTITLTPGFCFRNVLGTIFYGENLTATYLPSGEDIKDLSNLNIKLDNNSFRPYVGNTIYFTNGCSIKNENDVISVSMETPLIDDGEISTLDVSSLYKIPTNKYIKYTGADYQLLTNSSIIHDGESSRIEPPSLIQATRASIDSLSNLNVIYDTLGNYQKKISADLSIPQGTFFMRSPSEITTSATKPAAYFEGASFKDFNFNHIKPNLWCRKYPGKDILISNGTIVHYTGTACEIVTTAVSEGLVEVNSLEALLEGLLLKDTTKYYKLNNYSGAILYKDSYITYNNATVTIYRDCPTSIISESGLIYLEDISGANLASILLSIVQVPYKDYKVKYTGANMDILPNSIIYKSNNSYTIENVAGFKKNLGEISFDNTASNAEKMVFINNLITETSDNAYYKYISDSLTLSGAKLYFTHGPQGIVLSATEPSNFSSLTPVSSTGQLLMDLSILAAENGSSQYVLVESVSEIVEIISKDSYVIKSNNTLSQSNELPYLGSYTNKGDLATVNFDSILSLQNNELYYYVGEKYTISANSTFVVDGQSSVSINNNTSTLLLPVSEDLNTLLSTVARLNVNECLKYTGVEIKLAKDNYLIRIDDTYYVSPSELVSSTFDNFNVSTLKNMRNLAYYKYEGEDITFEKNNYLINHTGTLTQSAYPSLIELKTLNIKEINSLINNSYIRYVGEDISLYDMFIKLNTSFGSSLSETVLDNIFYIENTDLNWLRDETTTLDFLQENPTTMSFENRFKAYSIGSSPKKYYYDTKLGYFPLKKLRYISFMAKFGYPVSQADVVYTKKSMHDIDNKQNTSLPNSVTNVFLPQRGYGGTRLRNEETNSWQNELPWQLDPVAFQETHLKNTYDENVTLCDISGKEIVANNGEFPVSSNETVTVITDDIAEGSSKAVKLVSFADNFATTLSTINIYRPKSISNYIWALQDEVYINMDGEIGSQQALTNIAIISPSELRMTAPEKVTFEASIDGTSYKASNDFILSSRQVAIVYYKVPQVISEYPSFLKVKYGNLEKVIKLDYAEGTNYIYENIVPAFYIENSSGLQVVTYNNSGNYTLGTDRQLDQNTKPELIEKTDFKTLNLPIFNIGSSKTYYTYDPSYDNPHLSTDQNKVHFRTASYINSLDVSSNVTCDLTNNVLTCTYANNGYTFTLDKNTLDLSQNDSSYLSLVSQNFVITDDSEIQIKASIANTAKDVYVIGARGPIYMRKPNYPTFKDLIINKQYIISEYGSVYNASSIKAKVNNEALEDVMPVTFDTIETNKVTFTNKLPIDYLNDGESHFIRIEVLTQKTVPTTNINCFGDDYEELSLADIELFPPDRVYFNPRGYPSSPVTINNQIYRSENNVFYTNLEFTNNNNAYIRECDINGRFITYYISNGELQSRTISYSRNDNVDKTFIPNKPNYTSCQDWFEGEFFISGNESNPFWQTINLTSKFDNVTQVWNQVLTINKYEKVGQTLKQVEVPADEAYLQIYKGSYVDLADGEITQYYNTDYLNLFDGVIRFIAVEPESQRYSANTDNTTIIKYGICADNTIKDNFHLTTGNIKNIPGYLQSSYTVNSRKNYANNNEKDSAIVEVTELGIFNKAHVLLAYATFPPIEYRSDTQHVSFTSFIKYGTCSVS